MVLSQGNLSSFSGDEKRKIVECDVGVNVYKYCLNFSRNEKFLIKSSWKLSIDV